MSDASQPRYSLLDEPWIPVVYDNGQFDRLSLRAIWDELPLIRELWHTTPTIVVTLHRLLMAIWYRADAESWRSIDAKMDCLDRQQAPVQRILEYLESHRASFDLFDAERPFYQVATLRDDPKMNPGPNTILRHSAVPHFDQSDDDNPTPIPASEVVLWLLSHQGYALGGRITNSSDSVYAAHLVNGLVVLLRGRNLFETLVYSMPIYNQTKPFVYLDSAFDTDIPAWEQPTPVQAKRIPYGWLDVLTWQSRRVLLLPEWIDQQWKVRRVIVSGGYDLDDRAFRDPMQFQRTTKDGPRLLKMNVDRATWRDLMPCLAAYTTNDSKEDGIGGVIKPDVLDELEEMSNSAHVRIQVIGIGNDKGKMEIWRQEIVNVSAQIFTNTTMQIAIEQALQACKNGELCMNTAMYVYAEEMLKRGGARKIRTEDITGYAHSLGWRVYYWGNLEQLYTEHVLYRLEALLAITDPEALAEQVSQITRIWFDTLVAYIQTVYGTSANAGLHAHGLHALSVGERALIASFYKYGLRRKEVNDE